mmetsp:Transcript_100681/g.285303  ORF Transcript_100681/g.285303 Transcript_100681/m.285303 type:complete len:204 (-) Transcript_100681:109-720(-)
MTLQQEILKSLAAATVVALHCLGGDHFLAPSSTIAIAVSMVQLFSLLHWLASPEALKERAAKKAAACKADGPATAAWQDALALAGKAAGTAAEAVWGTAGAAAASLCSLKEQLASLRCPCVVPVAGVLALTVPYALRELGLTDIRLVLAVALASGGLSRVMLPALAAPSGARCKHCMCGEKCKVGSDCPYDLKFWSDLPGARE